MTADPVAVCYQLASRLLQYPDEALLAELPLLRAVSARLRSSMAAPLLPLLDYLRMEPSLSAQAEYVQTFDLRRRCGLFLTYYSYGDTRKRGMALLAFKHAYRRGGVTLADHELPDHLAVVLEFAATVDLVAGQKLLIEHRAGLEMLGLALRDAESPYGGVIAAVSATLPRLRGDEREALQRLIAQGPPGEEVGLEPFAPPDYMGVRR
jgi:nitrate reductase delta subunit